jgi:hypothetical protein
VVALFACIHAARARSVGGLPVVLAAIGSFAATSSLAFGFGPLVLLPTVNAATTATLLLRPRQRYRAAVVAFSCLLVALPCALEAVRVVPASYRFHAGVMSIVPRMVRFPEVPTLVCLLVGSLLTILSLTTAVSRIRDALSAAERSLQIQAWHLRQLVPDDLPPPSQEG